MHIHAHICTYTCIHTPYIQKQIGMVSSATHTVEVSYVPAAAMTSSLGILREIRMFVKAGH